MDSLIDRLQHQRDDFDPTGLDAAQHLGTVVRRGRRYRTVATTLGALGATVALAGSAVAVPAVARLLQGPAQPTVAATPDGPQVAEVPASDAPRTTDAAPPVVEQPAPPAFEAPAEAPAEEQVAIDAVPPALDVLEPVDGAVVASAKVTFSGTTEPGSRVAVGEYEATVDAEGRWSLLLIAAEGANTVTFEATDAAGNTTVRTTSVTYRPPAATKDTTTAPTGEQAGTEKAGSEKAGTGGSTEKDQQQQPGDSTLTASQASDRLTAAPHTGRYSGTAAPGAKVAVVSEHGTGYAWADDAGRWEVWVDFTPPGGETTFPVTVRLYHQPEVARTFQLTTVAEEVAAFTATQQFGAVSASAPTNVYSGTGQPGHEVWIWTELHGQATTVIGADGTWQVSLTYADVVAGDAFAVKAKDLQSGARHYFEVVVTE